MGHTMILYHQTSPENARKILRSQEMKPGSSWSYAGSGIYFAATPRATNHKARCKGVILSCKVDFGRVREIDCPGHWIPGFWQFWYGYDSIKITSTNGVEYVVFDSSRVKTIRLYQGSCDDSREELKKLGLVGALYVGAWVTAPEVMMLVHGLALAAKMYDIINGAGAADGQAEIWTPS